MGPARGRRAALTLALAVSALAGLYLVAMQGQRHERIAQFGADSRTPRRPPQQIRIVVATADITQGRGRRDDASAARDFIGEVKRSFFPRESQKEHRVKEDLSSLKKITHRTRQLLSARSLAATTERTALTGATSE